MNNEIEKWSADNDEFRFDSLTELLEYYDELRIGDKVFYANAIIPKASSFFDIDDFFEELENRAYDIGGEYAEDCFNTCDYEKDELRHIINNWLNANFKMNFYQIFDIKEHILTEEDFKDIL